jgi:hypothetical protein
MFPKDGIFRTNYPGMSLAQLSSLKSHNKIHELLKYLQMSVVTSLPFVIENTILLESR